MKNFAILLLSVLLPVTAAAQSAPQYTRVLVPLYFEQPINGAHGSVWTTQLSIYNSGTTPVNMGWCSVAADTEACILAGHADGQIAAGQTQNRLPPFSSVVNPQIPGRQIHFETIDGDQLSFGLRVADISRSSATAGTEIPIVRERDFRTGIVRLPNVPIDPRFRLTLRLYELNLTGSDFTISVYDSATNQLLGSSNVHLTATTSGAFRFEPAYAQLGDLTSIVPAGAPLPSSVRIEVSPKSERTAFWTFVSITNNETQQLTLITPQ